MPCLAKGYSSCLPIGSKESNGCRPHLDSTIYLATSSIHGERHSGPCCSSTKHQGDLSWMPLQSVDSLAPEMVLRLSCSSAGMLLRHSKMRLPLARSWMRLHGWRLLRWPFSFWRQFLVGHLLWHVRIVFPFVGYSLLPTAWKPSKRRGFAASPIDTELTTRRRRRDADPTTTRRRPDDDATSHSRRTRVQPPDPQTTNGNPSLRIREKKDYLG